MDIPRPALPARLKSVAKPAVVLRVTSRDHSASPDPGADRPVALDRSAVAVLAEDESAPVTAPQWLRLGNRGHLVRDPEKLDARLRAADPAAPRPLLLVYGPGSDLVRGAATIVGLRPVSGSLWVFELGTREPELEGRVVVSGGRPVRRTQGVTYYGPTGPGRGAFLAGLPQVG